MISAKSPSLPNDIVEYIEACGTAAHSESYLINVLQMVQRRFGYLSREHMDEVSQLMQVPAARVTGVATFYHFFSLKPRGKNRVTVCMGTACFVRGAGKVLERIKELLGIEEGETTEDGLFSIEYARCLGACALAPVMVVNQKVYGNVKPADVAGILAEYGHKKAVDSLRPRQ
jgi:NADH:ubiquinone oxidoreductase subunit E